MIEWTEQLLDELWFRGDPEADDLIATCSEQGTCESGAKATHHLAHAGVLPGANSSPTVQNWLSRPVVWPEWVDADLIRLGQTVFHDHGLEIGLALYCASLPEGYASAKGAKALWLTGTLVTDVARRINETAQFLMDTLEPGAMTASNPNGIYVIRRVRLMHAAVRWLILSDPRIEQVDDDNAVGHCWSSTWGTPLNQLELIGTLLTFTLVVFDTFQRLALVLTDTEKAAYLHTWCLIGWELGISPALLPIDMETARQLETTIRSRIQHPSEEGRLLETALLTAMKSILPRPMHALPGMLTRYCASPEALATLGLDRGAGVTGRTRPRLLTSARTAGRRLGLVRRAGAWVSTEMLASLIRAGRGSRPPFVIPSTLADSWNISPALSRQGSQPPQRASLWHPRAELRRLMANFENAPIADGSALARIGVGTAAFILPRPFARLWVGSDGAVRDVALITRSFAVREVALGAGVIVAGANNDPVRPWIDACLLSDVADLLSTVIGLSRSRRKLLLIAFGIVGVGSDLLAHSKLDSEN